MSQLTEAQMEEVLQRIIAVLNELNIFWSLDLTVVARPPADDKALQRLAASVPIQLPPSYLQLLRLHDGIDNFYGGTGGKLLPSTQRLEFPDFEKDWERPHYFFFIMDEDWNAVVFDTTKRDADGEMEVVQIGDNVDGDRWKSLSDFLIGYKERVEGWLAGELADRANLEDD